MLNALEIQQLTIILSMLVVNMLKTVGTYYAKRIKDSIAGNEARRFDHGYYITALLGVFVAYAEFGNSGAINTSSLIDTFMQAGYYAFTTNLVFDYAGKVTGAVSSTGSGAPAGKKQ